MDREIALLVQESARLSATDGVDKEEAEKPLLSAVELLKQAESAAGFPELQAPENYLLCAEAALGVDNVRLAHSCLESFLHARPAKNQFLVRAYFALGKVQGYHPHRKQQATASHCVSHRCLMFDLPRNYVGLTSNGRVLDG